MKTIEERAEYYERRCIDNANALGWSELPRPSESYKQGAKDQKIFDINKASGAFDKACGWLSTYPWYQEVLDEFIKVMGE